MYARPVSTDDILDIIIEGPDSLKQSGYFLNGRRPELRGFQINLDFRLADLPECGALTLKTASWAFASQLAEDDVWKRLEEIDGPTTAILETRDVSFTARNGARAGELVSYSHPFLKILGPAATEWSS